MRAVWWFPLIAAVFITAGLVCPLAAAQDDAPVLRIRDQGGPQNNTFDPAVSGVPPVSQESEVGLRAFPHVTLGAGRDLEYVGAFSAYGKFKRVSRLDRVVDTLITASVHGEEAPAQDGVQLFIGLTSNERIREDFEPPAHAVKVAKGQSPLADLRDLTIRLVGTDGVLIAPNGVTTDSRQRVIVTDPAAHAVHVLDYLGKASFRIVGGPGRRLQTPDGVAVDGDDNIYVSDYQRGMVLVYDSEGRFLRYIGNFKGEGVYEGPGGIAIDRKTGHIYLIDRPIHRLFILDLQGNVLQENNLQENGARSSQPNGSKRPGELNYPVGVIVHNDQVFVLDANGARLQIFDLQGKFRKQFFVSSQVVAPGRFAPSLCIDNDDNIYVTDIVRGTVRVYNDDGKLLGAFGKPGRRAGEFNAPAGIWADSQGRIYVADSANRRLQVFQISGTPPVARLSAKSPDAPSHPVPEPAGGTALASTLR